MNAGGLRGAMRRVPLGLVGALVLIVAAERAIGRRIVHWTTETAACWGYAGKSARTAARPCEVLGFGDSLMKFGFQPRVIEARTGRPAFNLAVYGGPSSHNYLTLRRVLEAGGRPKALVVCFQPIPYGSDPRLHVRDFAEGITANEAWDLASWSGDPGLFGWLMVARALPSARARLEIRASILSSVEGRRETNWGYVHSIFQRNWVSNRGAHVQTDEPHAPEGAAATARALDVYPHPFEAMKDDSIHLLYIRRFLDLAASRGILVIWVLPPMHPQVLARMSEIGLTGLATDLAGRVGAEYPNVVVVDGRDAGYDASAFCEDAVHLNNRGANAFSRDLADVLRRRLGRDVRDRSFVALPRYRAGDPEAALEDFAHSSKAVSEGRGMRR